MVRMWGKKHFLTYVAGKRDGQGSSSSCRRGGLLLKYSWWRSGVKWRDRGSEQSRAANLAHGDLWGHTACSASGFPWTRSWGSGPLLRAWMLSAGMFLKGERDQMLWGKQTVCAHTSHPCKMLMGMVGNPLPHSGRFFNTLPLIWAEFLHEH